MDKFLIKGPCKIKGQVSISGSKNAALPILASTILFDNLKQQMLKSSESIEAFESGIIAARGEATIQASNCLNIGISLQFNWLPDPQ